MDEEEVDPGDATRSVCALMRGRADQAGVRLVEAIDADLPPVWADARRFKQIIFNLLSNAVKFTPAGGSITVDLSCAADRGLVLQVIDTGIGIAEADIPKALARFSQVDSDLNRNYEGTGLGLALTQALVELHDGSIELASEVGVGTTATVRLPASRIVTIAAHGLASA